MRSLFFLTLLTVSLQVQAQRQGLWLNFQSGYGSSSISNGDRVSSFSSGVKPGPRYFMGLQLGYMFDDHTGWFSGLSYSRYTWREEITTQLVNATLENRQNYIQIPLYVQFATSKPGKPGAYFQVGVNANILTNAISSLHDNGNGRTIIKDESLKKAVKPFAILPFIGAGAYIPFSRSMHLEAGACFDYDFNDNMKRETKHKGNLYSISGRIALCFRISTRKNQAEF